MQSRETKNRHGGVAGTVPSRAQGICGANRGCARRIHRVAGPRVLLGAFCPRPDVEFSFPGALDCATTRRCIAMKEFAYIHEEGKLPEPLDTIPFFESFQDRHLNDILYSSYFIQADPGDIIIREGQEDSRIFILLAGKLEVTKGDEPIAKIEKPGEIFGELAVVSDEKRSASVAAKTNSLCLVIDQKFLHEIKPEEDNPSYYAALYGFISRVLAARLKTATEIVARLEKQLEETEAELAELKGKK